MSIVEDKLFTSLKFCKLKQLHTFVMDLFIQNYFGILSILITYLCVFYFVLQLCIYEFVYQNYFSKSSQYDRGVCVCL